MTLLTAYIITVTCYTHQSKRFVESVVSPPVRFVLQKMKVLIVTTGTKGDVLPAVALARALMTQGAHGVGIATHSSFRMDVEGSDSAEGALANSLFEAPQPPLQFFDLGDALDEALLESPEGQELSQAGTWSKFGAARRFMAPLVTSWMDKLMRAYNVFQPTIVVLFTIPIFVSYTALEKAGGSEVPVVWWHLMPFATTTQHAPPVGFGDGHTYFSFAAKWKWGLAYKTVYELIYKDAVDQKREDWGMTPVEESPYATLEPPLTVMAYSPALCPPPSDWDPEKVHVVGNLIEGSRPPLPPNWEPPVELVAPLGLGRSGEASSSRPVVFCFGSYLALVPAGDQKRLLSACVRAACEISMGAIVCTKGAASDPDGGRGVALLDAPTQAMLLADPTVALFDGEVPHDWLFARASAVVCHGGGGTVHAALTAGCPVVVSPVKPDDSSQAYWGSVVEKRGVGKLSQPAASHKSGKSLAKDIRAVMGPEADGLRQKVSSLGELLRGEAQDAGANAAKLVLTEAARCLALKGTPIDLEALRANAAANQGGSAAASDAPPPPPGEDFSLKYDVHSSMR